MYVDLKAVFGRPFQDARTRQPVRCMFLHDIQHKTTRLVQCRSTLGSQSDVEFASVLAAAYFGTKQWKAICKAVEAAAATGMKTLVTLWNGHVAQEGYWNAQAKASKQAQS